MRCCLAFALVCFGLSAQIVQESFSRDPGPLDFIRGEGHEQAILQALTGDSLVGMNALGRVVPRLAERWEIKGTTLRFYLRSDARFRNGRTVTVEDACWTLQAIQADATASPTKRAILLNVRSRKVGKALELSSDRPPARLLMELVRIPIAQQQKPGEGSGPFALDLKGGEWHLSARPHFLQPKIPGLRFRLLADEQAILQNLQKGWLSIGVPPPRRGLRPPASHCDLHPSTLAQLIAWSRIGSMPLKALERWRKEALPEDFFGGRALPSRGLFPEGLGFQGQSIKRAEPKLKGQHWEILYTAGDEPVEKALLALRERAKREGVVLDPRPVESALLFERLTKGDFQLACAISLFDPHPWTVLDLLVPQGAMNFSAWTHERLAALLPRLHDAHSSAWRELQALWAENPGSLPLLDFRGSVWVDRRLEVAPGPMGLYLTTPGAAGWYWKP
ncbi:MAG: ABC transporter substrate-binding protein [Holophaga sp.]|nr:ABC transporter substrate-binding protein [Holophaga sp.]